MSRLPSVCYARLTRWGSGAPKARLLTPSVFVPQGRWGPLWNGSRRYSQDVLAPSGGIGCFPEAFSSFGSAGPLCPLIGGSHRHGQGGLGRRTPELRGLSRIDAAAAADWRRCPQSHGVSVAGTKAVSEVTLHRSRCVRRGDSYAGVKRANLRHFIRTRRALPLSRSI